ncbi:transmembrane emp24 domain-containing protein p24beta3 [Elaeis guineensis]|uniref:Transmembrane emp24 domain-containing protein p24beta3 n=1 Tax=Elaeis guineensis var. tenera TaxID=51953 RepID=A0A6I9S1T0_ELAGV|nr:transmembrane emp24 domain-containing protein p24beta3 [Elaeis guineensis]
MERRKRSIGFAEVLSILGLLLSCPRRLSALSITVNDVECVSEFVLSDGDTISGNFVVVDRSRSSDHPGIDMVVQTSRGDTVHSLKGTSGDKFEFKAPRAGMYKFCFHNPSRTPETVSFYIHVGHIPNEHDLAKDEHLDPVKVRVAQLREALESVTSEQRYLKAREARHRWTSEGTRKRLIFCTMMEYLVLVCASGLQVVYIRRLFNKSVAYNTI